MTTRTDTLRRLLAPLLATLLVASSVAVPVMDADGPGNGPVVESEHDAGSCVVGHDHTVCSQAGANRPLPTAERSILAPRLALRSVRETPVRATADRLGSTGHRSRAPPLRT